MKEKLGFGHMGNGVVVWDSGREVNHDYPKVAHISYDRTVNYYENISSEAKAKIENFARYDNMSISVTQQAPVLRPLDGSAFMSPEEKGCFLQDYGCSADGVMPFIREAWDDAKLPMENLELFRQWWASGKAEEFLG